MDEVSRRSAMTLGLTVAVAAPFIAVPSSAASEMYGADAGTEIMPGIRQVALGEWPVDFGGYTKAVMNDYVMGPGAAFPEEKMMTDSICHILEGEFWVKQGDKEFTAKPGHVFTCAKDSLETDKNTGSVPAVMRVIELMPA